MHRSVSGSSVHAQEITLLTKSLHDYVHYFNFRRPAAALGFKSPVQFRTERGF
jgi:transposase InsO family protein